MTRWKLFIPIFVALAAAMGVLLSDLSQQFSGRYQRHRTVEAERTANLIRERARAEIKSLSVELARTIAAELPNLDPQAQLNSRLYLAAGLVKKSDLGAWELEWSRHREVTLTHEEIARHLPVLPLDGLDEQEVAVAQIPNSDGKNYLAIVVPLNIKAGNETRRQLGVGYLPIYHFMDITTSFKGQDEEAMLVDSKGVALSHPDQQYVGAKFDHHPVVKELIETLAEESSPSRTVSTEGGFVGAFERVPESNLFALTKFPLMKPLNVLLPVGARAFMIVISMSVLCWMAIFLLIRRERDRAKLMEEAVVRRIADRTPAEFAEEVNETRKAFADLAKPLAVFVKGPLHAVRGYVQILKTKISDKSAREILEKIENESRRLSDFSDDLAKEVNLADRRFEACDLSVLIEQALSPFRGAWIASGWSVEENLRNDLRVKADFPEIKGVFKSLFSFIGQELAKAQEGQRVVLSTHKLGGMADATIEVQGMSLEREIRREMFVPFKVRIEESPLGGFELALARAIVDAHGGDISIESLGEKGFRFHVRLTSALSKEEIVATELTPAPETKEPFPSRPIGVGSLSPKSEAVAETEATETGASLSFETASSPDFEVVIRKPKIRMDT